MRVVFWGTPDFGIPSLDAMGKAGHDIAGVVTNPDRPAGRGRRLASSPVKEWAIARDLPVLQPERPTGQEFMESLAALEPDISVVAAYGQILREEALELPPHGSLNVHASLLPELRGAAPVNWAIIRGHAESGVTIMRMVLGLDAGPMLRTVRTPIGPETTAGELYDRLSRLGAAALVETLSDVSSGEVVEDPQDDGLATYAPKLDREMARIDWSLTSREVSCWIRGCDPWPGGWTTLDDEPVQCFTPSTAPDSTDSDQGEVAPGTIVSADPAIGLLVATGRGRLVVGDVRPAGKRRMAAADWIRGRRDLEGRRLI